MTSEIINGKSVSIKEVNNQRLITFKEIDAVHERPNGTADRTFRENKKRFIEGTDYYKISKSQNNEFRGLEIPNRGITLIAESGYLMLVKSFTDELAWKVQRELVNTYFRVKEDTNSQQEILNQQMQAITMMFQTIQQSIQSQQPQPLYPQRFTPFKTKTFTKLDLLSEYYKQPFNTLLHNIILELEDTYDISLTDYKAQYLINTKLQPEEAQILDIIEYNQDIRKMFNLTLNNILDQSSIPYQDTIKRQNIFTQTQVS